MIKFIIMDVDGTLTDGKIYMGIQGELFKAFDIKDGYGIKDILPKYEIIPIIITARESQMLKNRCDELNVERLHQNIRNKMDKLDEIIKDYNHEHHTNFTYENVAYIGDDILDLHCMISVKAGGGIIGCPRDASKEVLKISDFVSNNCGGNGAVREFIEYIKEIGMKNLSKIKKRVKEAIDYLASLNLEEAEVGTYRVNEYFYYMIQEYETKQANNCKLESHKKYIDIQWVIHGVEAIESTNIAGLVVDTEYNEDKDVMFWKEQPNMMRTVLRDGSYIVLYPKDAHKPSIAVGETAKIKKLIAKIGTE